MSTTYIPFAFYGCYFPSEEAVLAYLKGCEVEADSDSVYSAPRGQLGMQYMEDSDSFILGFSLRAGESEDYARQLWQKRFGANDNNAKSYFDNFTY